MPVSHVGAVYAVNSKMLQRIFIPDADDSEIDAAHVGQGEALMRVPIEVFRSGDHTVVQDYIGQPAHDGICVVVHRDTSLVVDRIVADPEIYNGGSGVTPEGHLLIKHSKAAHGDLWEGSCFSRDFAEVDYQTGETVAVTRQNIDTAAPADARNFHVSLPNDGGGGGRRDVPSVLPSGLIDSWKLGPR